VHTIYLDSDDDIVSLCDRLEWSWEEGRVILVLPDEGHLLADWLDLVQLRRCAERLRLEAALVTRDGDVAGQAKALGFPTFSSVRSAQKGRRRWWRGRRGWHAPTRPGGPVRLGQARPLKSLADEADRREMYRRLTPRPGWKRWLWRYLGIVLFFLTVAAFFLVVAYAVPGATVTLHPQVQPLQVSKQIVADPQLETINFSGSSVPARLLPVSVAWQAEVATTGSIDLPAAAARGSVVFVNSVETPVTVPAGTVVSTTAGERITFKTLEAVAVPAAVGGTAEVGVVAVEPGPTGNVAANMVNRIEGALALQLEVRNLEAMTGGGVRTVPAVSEKDQERLRAQVLQHLQALAAAEMQELLTEDEFLARDSLRVVEIREETYSRFPGEPAERLALEIRADLDGTAVDASQANDLVYEEVAAAVQPGYELVPSTLHFYADEVLGVDNQGRVTFLMIGEALSAASLDLEEPVGRIAGQKVGVATAYLFEQLPLRRYPTIQIWPNWFDRMPYLSLRIHTKVEPRDT
jgi:hypothetical protein